METPGHRESRREGLPQEPGGVASAPSILCEVGKEWAGASFTRRRPHPHGRRSETGQISWGTTQRRGCRSEKGCARGHSLLMFFNEMCSFYRSQKMIVNIHVSRGVYFTAHIACGMLRVCVNVFNQNKA